MKYIIRKMKKHKTIINEKFVIVLIKNLFICGSIFQTHKSKLFSNENKRFLYLIFNATMEEKLFSHI